MNPAAVQGQAGPAQPSWGTRYNPNQMFLDQNRQKPWYTTASNQMPMLDITIIEEWLLSGGSYSTYTDPARILKLLLDNETSRTLSAMLTGKADVNRQVHRHNPDRRYPDRT